MSEHSPGPMQVNLTNCDREPIHIPGSIQPHGAMLVLDEAGRVTHASANAAQFLSLKGPLVGADVEAVLGPARAHDIRNAVMRSTVEAATVLPDVRLDGSAMSFDITVHRYLGRVFVEFEAANPVDARATLDLTQSLVRRLGVETDIGNIARASVRLLRAVLGYDRVMVYRFLHNGAGRVIAEARRPGLGSFLGQHFPASDIPHQARRLYLLNTIRMIGDAGYVPVPLVGMAGTVDMSFAQLRSVSPIHCQYLGNMGVAASLSISILVDGKLWGLVACHHDTPRVVSRALRVAAELFGQYLSLQLSVAERRAELVAAASARQTLMAIAADLDPQRPVQEALVERLPEITRLIDSNGAGLWIDGDWSPSGATPDAARIAELVALIPGDNSGDIFATDDLRTLSGDPFFGSEVAGMMAIPISSQPRDYLLLFRSEEAYSLSWAGEPAKKMELTDEGVRLTPRGSFATWREDVRGRSRPWTEPDIAMAEMAKTSLRDIVLRHNESVADERMRLETRRRVVNAELNHRVKNIIALVKSIARQTGASAGSVAEYSTHLEGRLRALAFAHDNSLNPSTGDIRSLFEAEAIQHRHPGFPTRITVSGEPVALDERAFGVLALVVHELITNAAKYGALSTLEGSLAISWEVDDDGCRIEWREMDGPEVFPPQRSGFGTRLIGSMVRHDLGGSVDVDYAPDGVHAVLHVPARYIVPADAAPPPEPVREIRTPAALDGVRLLLVEDQALIALDTEEMLRGLGAEVAMAGGEREALELLAEKRPDCAVLDFNLGDATSEYLAERLKAEGVPFVFATGYSDAIMIPEHLRDVPVAHKPLSGGILAEKIHDAMG